MVIRQFNTDEKPIKHQFTPYIGTEEIMYIIYSPHSTVQREKLSLFGLNKEEIIDRGIDMLGPLIIKNNIINNNNNEKYLYKSALYF